MNAIIRFFLVAAVAIALFASGALAATWIFQKAYGNGADIMSSRLGEMYALLVGHDGGVVPDEDLTQRVKEQLAVSMVASAAAYSSITEDRRRQVFVAARWSLENGIVSDEGGLRAKSAAECIVQQYESAPRRDACDRLSDAPAVDQNAAR